ncbi:mitogen-activated protein kinase kinase kinase 18-like [Amaranthus tricolor]|uniref:mitogen-activated protein kinase kinase kinase 18-like n=1 Tax=Amaranthus tricolor TaxID=29722 RepID=UPI0025838128|nr:mitogen-activated protein kinase kinase kinase 18-like [Amaranthus tricolor]
MEIDKNWIKGKLIGNGSYGSVYIGVQESNGVRFAVKSASKYSNSSLQALENEVEILRSLSSSSPFIVSYYGDDETTSDRNLFLEYLPSGDVSKSGGISDEELIRSYTWCLVMALKEIHSKNIVHCDLKGSNVLVDSINRVAKLCDFGSSIQVVSDSEFHQQLKIVPRGSPLWMAPEVVRGESQGFEADIWSLGCTVIEMFTGFPAWQDSGAHTLFKIGYSDEVPEYPSRLTEVAKDFLNKCLVRNPEERWSCDQLLLHPFLLPVPAEFSPRSIFDLQNLYFSDDDEHDHNQFQDEQSLVDDHETEEILDRIGELATISGVNWESDGWVDVRSSKQEQKEQEVFEGATWEYSEIFEGETVKENDNLIHEKNISGVDGGNGDSYGGLTKIEIDLLFLLIVEVIHFLSLILLINSFTIMNKFILLLRGKYEHYICGSLKYYRSV